MNKLSRTFTYYRHSKSLVRPMTNCWDFSRFPPTVAGSNSRRRNSPAFLRRVGRLKLILVSCIQVVQDYAADIGEWPNHGPVTMPLVEIQNLWSTCVCKIYMSYFCTLQSIYESANNNDGTYNDSCVETVQNCKVMYTVVGLPVREGSTLSVHRCEFF